MWLTPLQKSKITGEKTERRYFQCPTNREYGKNMCTMHNASHKAVYTIVLEDIRRFANMALQAPDKLMAALTAAEDKQKQARFAQMRKEHENGANRLDELALLLQRAV